MIIEGKNQVKEALVSGATVDKLYILKGYTDKIVQSIIDMARDQNTRVTFVEKDALDQMTTNKHQGVVAVVTEFRYSEVQDILDYAASRGEKLFMLILDGIEDPHNLGSIMRTAEISGVHGIVIPNIRAVGITDTVVRASSGASMHLKVARVTNINDVIRGLKDNFVNVYAADMQGQPMYSADFKGDVALVIGGEGKGVKQLTLKLADKAVSIPMHGKVDSLNASVAAGILMYEAVRQRYNNG